MLDRWLDRWIVPSFIGGFLGLLIAKVVGELFDVYRHFVRLQLITVVVCVATALAIQRRLSARTNSHDGRTHCLHCGYDLRATESRCPECGHFIPLPLERP